MLNDKKAHLTYVRTYLHRTQMHIHATPLQILG